MNYIKEIDLNKKSKLIIRGQQKKTSTKLYSIKIRFKRIESNKK